MSHTKTEIPTADGIDMQDIRLIAGEGKLTEKTVQQAIEIIRKQRLENKVDKDKVYWAVNKHGEQVQLSYDTYTQEWVAIVNDNGWAW